MKRRGLAVPVAAGSATIALLVGATVAAGVTSAAQDPGGGAEVSRSASSSIKPDGPAQAGLPMSDAGREALAKRVQDRREAAAARGGGGAHGAGSARETRIAADSEANFIKRNNKNTRASAVSNTIAEPSAANDSTEVLYGGNTYFSRSADSGFSWLGESIPGGPADAPLVCCDLDAVHHGGLDTTFALALYVNSSATNGVVKIFVRRSTIAGGNDCSYTIDPGGTGTLLPDYPHIAVSNNFVYLTTNNLSGSSWTGAQIRRFNASQMANCQTTTTNTVTYTGSDGQRVLTPVENSSTTQYFGLNRTANVFRIIRWPESTTGISTFDRSLSHGTAFINSDCRGGTGNFDFIERSTSWSIGGFRLRGAVVPNNRLWFVWNAGRDASHPQAHLHSAIFTEPGLSTLSSPAVFNSTRCFGYPTLGANGFGEFGLTFAHGGRNGGGGSAAQGAIAVDDSSSAGNFFPTISTTASGTHNRSDGRYGDYFTLRRNDKCPSTGWVATNYALSGGNTSPSHVNARYVEFQSSTRLACP